MLQLQISQLVRGFDRLERISVLNNPICLSKLSLRAYVARTMPRLKYFNDVLITEADKEHSPLGNISSLGNTLENTSGKNSSFDALTVDPTQQVGLKRGSGQGSVLQVPRPLPSENLLQAVRTNGSQREEMKSSNNERVNGGKELLSPSFLLAPTQQHTSSNTSHLQALQYPVTSYDHISSSFSTSSPLRSTTATSTTNKNASTNLINLFGVKNSLNRDSRIGRGEEKSKEMDLKSENVNKKIEIEKNKKDQEILFKLSVEKYFRKIIHDTLHSAHRL